VSDESERLHRESQERLNYEAKLNELNSQLEQMKKENAQLIEDNEAKLAALDETHKIERVRLENEINGLLTLNESLVRSRKIQL
jgi:hypothetical protein